MSANARLSLYQIYLMLRIGNLQGSLDTRNTPPYDQGVLVYRRTLGEERLMVLHPGHRCTDERLGFLGRLTPVLVDPGCMLADIGHLKKEGIEARPLASPTEGGFVHVGRAGGDHNPVQSVLLNVVLNEDVRDALPPKYRDEVWPEVEPKGTVDVTGTLRYRSEEPNVTVLTYNLETLKLKDCRMLSKSLSGIALSFIFRNKKLPAILKAMDDLKGYVKNLRKAGIRMRVRHLEWSVYSIDLYARNYDATQSGDGVEYEADYYPMWHSSQADAEMSANYANFRDAEVDAIVEKLRVTLDPDERIPLYHRFHAIMHEEQPFTFMLTQYDMHAYNRRLVNVRYIPFHPGRDVTQWRAVPRDQIDRSIPAVQIHGLDPEE